MYFKLSIIIPVYNTESFIKNCIESCISQNLSQDEFEIIVIDDGSTDKSISIVKSFQNIYSNIVVIQKENGGVSSARNTGISIAKGEYILFVDSDDTIEENTLNKIVLELKNKNLEILILNSAVYLNEIKENDVYLFPKELTGVSFSGIELFQKSYQRGSVCGVVFRRQFIVDNKLEFSEKVKNGEDSLFLAMAFLYSLTVCHLNYDFYKVNVREGSASRFWDYKRVFEMLNILNVIEGYIEKNNLNNYQLEILNVKAYEAISNSLYRFFSMNHLDKYDEIIREIKKSKLYPIKSYGSKHFKYKIILLNFSIHLFCAPFLIRRIFSNVRC